jgi:hypothetical protein
MAINKNFVVKNGLEVADDLLVATDSSQKVGVGSTVPSATFGVGGGIAAADGLFVGILTAQNAFEVGIGGTVLSAGGNTGKVGINSADPNYQLEIVGTGGTSLFISNGSINATSAIIGENTTINSDGVNVSGSVTATDFYGDGANLTGIATEFKATVGIESGGLVIGAATTLNFIGLGNTFLLNGTTVDISIEGGGGGGVGTAIDYASSGLRSPFSYIDATVNVTENITFDETNAGIDSSYVVVQEPFLLIDPGVTVTVGAGKTLVTDIFMLESRPDLNRSPSYDQLVVTGVSTLGVVTGATSLQATDIYASNVTATSFYGDGSNLTNTGPVLNGGSGSQSVVLTSLVSGIQTTAATDAGLTYNSDTDTITAGIFSGSGASLTSIPNSALDNSTISGISLGGTLGTLTLGVSGNGLSGSDTYDGSAGSTFTVSSNATNNNTASTVVFRDSSGNFSAGTITADLTGDVTGNADTATNATTSASCSGNAATATILQTSRAINGVNFNGSAAITTPINVTDESSDTTCFPVFTTDATGNRDAHTDSSALTYNASTGTLAATNVNSTSDVNLKTDIHNIEDAVTTINQIRGVKFRWRELDIPSVGVIAQEVEEVLPELISVRSDNGTKSVNYNGLVGVLIEAVKELSTRVEHLESQLNNK